MARTPEPGDANPPGSYEGLAINDGKVRCPICDKDIKVGMGGLQNFRKQHNPGVSKACRLGLEKKNKAAAHQQSQPGLLSFFTKQSKELVPPTVPTQTRVIAYDMESTSSGPRVTPVISRTASLASNKHAVNLITTLEKAINNLPALPEASETDEIALFAQSIPTELNKDDAWEYLDPMLNRFLGFNRSVESISNELRGGERGLAAMVRYLREFVGRYQIDGGLLEGKINRLLNVIQMRSGLTHSDVVVISDSEDMPSEIVSARVSVTKHRSSDVPAKSCPGYRLIFSPSQQAHTSYPFGLHSLISLPWDYSARRDGFFLVSHLCTGMVESNGRCKPCDKLGKNEYLEKIIARYTDGVHENAPLVFHGIGGLIGVVRRKTLAIDALRLRRLNDVKKLIGQEGVIDVHKQMLLALSSQRIPRIDRVLRVGFKHGSGIHSMLELIKKAAEGTYHPKGFDEEDDLQALLFLRLGGARVADIAHRIFGTPSVSTIRTRTTVPQIQPSPSFPTRHEIEHNVTACFEGLLDNLGVSAQKMLHAVIMFDELSVEKRPRWDDKSNKILGVCREHGCETSLEFTSEEDLQTLWEELACGKIHLAHEATVGAIAVLSPLLRLYSARPVLISGSCKRETAEEHAALLKAVVDTAIRKKDLTRLRIVSLASDGESRRGKALAKLTYIAPLAPSSPIYDQLVHLDLLDLFVGVDDITADKDYKHVFKRLRNTILREKGCVVHGVKLTRGLIRKHLQDTGLSNAHVDSVLDPTDKQDVVLAYHLLRDLWCLPPANLDSCTQPYSEVREALRLYGQLSYHLIFPYICIELSLSEQLEHLSAAMHLILALYVHDDAKSHFIPTSLFVDIGIMVKNAFFCIAKAKLDHPMDPFFIVLLGTDRLESLFGILRTMVGNDANLDVLQLALRVTATTEVSNILAKHPEWDKSPRRLRLPNVSKSMVDFSNSVDHTGPRAYLHPEKLYPSGLTLATPWKRGRNLLEDKYPWITAILHRVSTYPNASILAPYGSSLVTNCPTNEGDDTEMDEHTSSSLLEGPPVGPESYNTMGMQELEDAAAEVQWRNGSSDGQGPFSNTVQIGGVVMNKSRAISQHFRYVTSASSTDRLRRVAQESRFKPTDGLGTSISGDAHVDGPFLSVLQPVATLVFCEQKLFLCIAEVNGLFLDFQSVDEIPFSVLSEKIAQVSYQALRLVPASFADDPDGTNDWRSSNLFSLSAKVPGVLVQPINPAVASHNPCDSFFLFESSVLMAIAANLRDRIVRGHRKAIPHVRMSDYFPYQEQHGKACFVMENVDTNADVVDHVGLACPKCQPMITFNSSLRQRIVEHIGAHILHDPSVDRSSEPCGLCLRPAPLCKIILQKTKGRTGNLAIDMNTSSCPNLVKFSITTAAKCSDASPCTNHPMRCPYCPKLSPAVWSYTFRQHMLRIHPAVPLGKHKMIWTISKLEKEGMRQVWEHRLKQPKVRTKTQCTPLVISETHRTRLVLSGTPSESDSEAFDEGLSDPDQEGVASGGEESDCSGTEDGTERDGSGEHDQEYDRPIASGSSVERGAVETQFDIPQQNASVCPLTIPPCNPYPSPVIEEQIKSPRQPIVSPNPYGDTPQCAVEESLITSATTMRADASIDGQMPTTAPIPNTEPELTRAGRRSKRKDMSGLSLCLCGGSAQPDVAGSIQCQRAGCETVWYHLECVGYEDAGPRTWICDACASTKRSRRR